MVLGRAPQGWPTAPAVPIDTTDGVDLRVLVLGGDGYLGWPTALHLSDTGAEVGVVDNHLRRRYDDELGVESLVPIEPLELRTDTWHALTGRRIETYVGDLVDAEFLTDTIRRFRPDTIVHFAEQRSAPYSMIDRAHAVHTQHNNVIGTLNLLYAIAEIDPSIHLIKLGTMGEYGTPNIDIEEGWLDVEHKGRRDRVLFPKRPGSFYHLSKVHDSHNIEFACRIWGLRATDLNQGVVYGQQTPQTERDPKLATRFDYDAVFGTVLNRFVIQAVLGEPLTVYGSGSQTRGIIDIRDTVECIRLAAVHPAEAGEFRVFNQLTESMSVHEMAKVVADAFPGIVEVENLENPRVEADSHYYNVVFTGLPSLGLKPHLLSDTLITSLFPVVERHRERVDRTALSPIISWRNPSNDLTNRPARPVLGGPAEV
jgi:UDP-sulfoquinovose synthase